MTCFYMFIYINVVILSRFKNAKPGSKMVTIPEADCANLRNSIVQKSGSIYIAPPHKGVRGFSHNI
jgi:hypothetical protein